jgi:hypothetical protein
MFTDGTLNYKIRWGASIERSWRSHRNIYLLLKSPHKQSMEFFLNNPLIHIHEGQLKGLVFWPAGDEIDQAKKGEVCNAHSLPGLRGVTIAPFPSSPDGEVPS